MSCADRDGDVSLGLHDFEGLAVPTGMVMFLLGEKNWRLSCADGDGDVFFGRQEA